MKRYASVSKRDFYGVRIYGLKGLKVPKPSRVRVFCAGDESFASFDEATKKALDSGAEEITVRDVLKKRPSSSRVAGKIRLILPPCEAAKTVRGSFDEVLDNVKASCDMSDDRAVFSRMGFDPLCDAAKRMFYDDIFVGFNRTRDLEANFDAYKIYIEGKNYEGVMADSRYRDLLFDCLVTNEISALMKERFEEAKVRI